MFNTSKIIRSFKKDGNKFLEQTKIAPAIEQPRILANLDVVALTKKVEQAKKENERLTQQSKEQEAELAKLQAAKLAKFQPYQGQGKVNASIADGNQMTYRVKPAVTPIPENAVTFNMVRLGYRIQYTPKMTVLLDNKNGVRQIITSGWMLPVVPLSRDEFNTLIDNRATVQEIERLYRCIRPEPNLYQKYFMYSEANEKNIW